MSYFSFKNKDYYLNAGEVPICPARTPLHRFAGGTGRAGFRRYRKTIYLFIYFPEHTAELVVWRYTIALGMHVIASFIVGFGINGRLLASVKGELPLMQGNLKFFAGGISLHSLYNITATVLVGSGIISF
jgi:hypothetical protein